MCKLVLGEQGAPGPYAGCADLLRLGQAAQVVIMDTSQNERLFSLRSVILSKFRNRMSTANMERLLFICLNGGPLAEMVVSCVSG